MVVSIITKRSLLEGKQKPVTVRALCNGKVVAMWSATPKVKATDLSKGRASITVKLSKACTIDAIEVEHDEGRVTAQMPIRRTPMARGETITIDQLITVETIEEDDEGVVIG